MMKDTVDIMNNTTVVNKSTITGPSTSNDIDFGYYPSKAVPWATKNYYPLSIDGFVFLVYLNQIWDVSEMM